ncbi:hypothetical protein GN156_10565 [bacterium LRH843]|nr:hypothetical protein [bacterium LRH843]
MKAAEYENLSLTVTKKQLNMVIMHVLDNDFKIFWGFSKGKMILNIYSEEVNNKLIFIRHKGYLELIQAKVMCQKVIQTLDNHIDFTNKVNMKSKESNERNKEIVYQEIDYYLLDLYEQKQLKNEFKVKEIKKELARLYIKWKQL